MPDHVVPKAKPYVCPAPWGVGKKHSVDPSRSCFQHGSMGHRLSGWAIIAQNVPSGSCGANDQVDPRWYSLFPGYHWDTKTCSSSTITPQDPFSKCSS